MTSQTIKHAQTFALAKRECIHCSAPYSLGNVVRHEHGCSKNPINLIPCPVCTKLFKPSKQYKKGLSTTCSKSCANSYFRTGPNNGMWNHDTYRTTCFLHHEKKCIICGESNIVQVHHSDGNHSNNDPSNLVPLCPTHHQYFHSKYRSLVEPAIIEYIKNWKIQQN